jgi:hypothetical protein
VTVFEAIGVVTAKNQETRILFLERIDVCRRFRNRASHQGSACPTESEQLNGPAQPQLDIVNTPEYPGLAPVIANVPARSLFNVVMVEAPKVGVLFDGVVPPQLPATFDQLASAGVAAQFATPP